MRINLNGVQITVANLNKSISIMQKNIGKSGYICLPNAYVLAKAEKNKLLSAILNNSMATFPDGKLLELLAKLKGYNEVSTVSGYYLLEYFLNNDKTSHYFYGTNDQTLNKLKKRIYQLHPKANLIGFKEAPYLGLDEIKNNLKIKSDLIEIAKLSPDILWIGLSSPKQDYIMHYYHNLFESTILVGIGAVFDYYSGVVKISPEWVKRCGFRWLYRFFREPLRMYRKTFQLFIFSFKIITKTVALKLWKYSHGRK